MSVRMRCDGAAHLADRIVDVIAERLAAFVTVEQRRENLRGQCGGREQQALAERDKNHVAELTCGDGTFRQLVVALDLRRLKAGRHRAVDPFCGQENAACVSDLISRQDVWDVQQHLWADSTPAPSAAGQFARDQKSIVALTTAERAAPSAA